MVGTDDLRRNKRNVRACKSKELSNGVETSLIENHITHYQNKHF